MDNTFKAAAEPVVPLAEILCTDELETGPQRAPDYETENRVFQTLAQALADDPDNILETFADTLLREFKAHSAGISLLTEDGKSFYWPAIAGLWCPHLGGGTPRDFGPCGDVLDQDRPLMFRHWERRYPYLREATPYAEQGLLAPFYADGRAVGTIWTIAHDCSRKFDREDLRQLQSLSRFASAAYQSHQSRKVEAARLAAVARADHEREMRRVMQELNAILHESEERYRLIFEDAPIAICSCDKNGFVESWNNKAVELWGRVPQPGDRYSGAHAFLHTDGKPMEIEQHPVALALKGRSEVMGARLLVQRSDGSQRRIVANTRPQIKNGELVGAVDWFYEVLQSSSSSR